jgi:hypothetical protein
MFLSKTERFITKTLSCLFVYIGLMLEFKVQVYDVNGKLVLNQTINGKTSIDASSLNEGVYNISLQSNEGVVNKKLVIVR